MAPLIGTLQQLSVGHHEHFVREPGAGKGYLASCVFCLSETYEHGFFILVFIFKEMNCLKLGKIKIALNIIYVLTQAYI